MIAKDVITRLQSMSDPLYAASSARFFKTNAGQYGEGDTFLGITVPEQRKIAREFKELPLPQVVELLHSPFHECRLTAVLIMAIQYKQGGESQKQAVYNAYLANAEMVNNWDLVDSSAEHIVGPHLDDNYKTTLGDLAKSTNLWKRRIAMLACFYYIKAGNPEPAFYIVDILKNDSHDLIQKATGWMLREVGKRCGRQYLHDWLLANDEYKTLPRTTLRYAIEHYTPAERKQFLQGTM